MADPTRHTIENLRLDLEAARAGKTWLLLPEGFRNDHGDTYPLPGKRAELQILVAIPIKPGKRDSGCTYLRRCLEALKQKHDDRRLTQINRETQGHKLDRAAAGLQDQASRYKAEMREAVNQVRQEAEKAVAGLNDLFALGREGIEGQMKAYLAGTEYQGERIDGEAFRSCFRMVTQAVKGLGLPSEQRDKARDAVMEEVAKSLEATQSAIAGAQATDSTDGGTEH